MPIFATRCTECDDRMDVLVKNSTDPLPACRVCNGERQHYIGGIGGFTLNGSGWYKPGSSVSAPKRT